MVSRTTHQHVQISKTSAGAHMQHCAKSAQSERSVSIEVAWQDTR
jgi:hypothetical protein